MLRSLRYRYRLAKKLTSCCSRPARQLTTSELSNPLPCELLNPLIKTGETDEEKLEHLYYHVDILKHHKNEKRRASDKGDDGNYNYNDRGDANRNHFPSIPGKQLKEIPRFTINRDAQSY